MLKKTGVPAGGYNRSLYEAAGAVFNDETGFWELNGLTDINQREMDRIFLVSSNFYLRVDTTNALANSGIRTNLYKNIVPSTTKCVIDTCARVNALLEVFRIAPASREGVLTYPPLISSAVLAFQDCAGLKRIIGVMHLAGGANMIDTFRSCRSLADVKIHGLTENLSVESSAVISYESLKFLLDYAANTKVITVTVHPTTYGYLTGDAEPTAEVGGTAEEWHALATQAAEKNISFVTTE